MKKTLLTTALALPLSIALSTTAIAGEYEGKNKEHYKHKMHKMYMDAPVVLGDNILKSKLVKYTAKESLGQDVLDAKGEVLGEVVNMGISKKGKVTYVVVDLDGMVMNDQLAIPYHKFGWNDKKQALTLDKTKAQLDAMAKELNMKKDKMDN